MKPTDPDGLPGRRTDWAEHQHQYATLPSHTTEEGVVWSRWQLTENERRAILDGACVELGQWTFGHSLQPVVLLVQGVNEPYIASSPPAGNGNA